MAQFRDQHPIALQDHMDWIKKALLDRRMRLFIATDQEAGVSVGTGRLDFLRTEKGVAVYETSITVAPPMRGRGYAVPFIASLVHECRIFMEMGKFSRGSIQANVKPMNHASLCAFASNEFVPTLFSESLVTLERNLL